MDEIKGGRANNEPESLTAGKFLETIKDLSYAKNADDLLDRLLKKIISLFDPEIATFLLKDQASGGWRYALAVGEKAESLKERFLARGEGIAGLAGETNQNIIITDPARDPRFNPEVDRFSGIEVRCLLAMPFHIEKKVYGLVYLINKKAGRAYNLEEFKAIQALIAYSELLLEKMVLFRQIKEMEDFDQLTGTFNLRAFFTHFQREIARSERYNTELSLLKVSIDYYQKIIQTFGQEAGDRVVLNLSYILKKTTRKVDLVARSDESDFFILLPQTNWRGAQKVKERILQILENQNLRSTGIPFTVTITAYSGSGDSALNLYKVPEINACLNTLTQKKQSKKYPTVGEELEEAISSTLFSAPK
jgi:diguanylate cyclase (GGDEF)-like protein